MVCCGKRAITDVCVAFGTFSVYLSFRFYLYLTIVYMVNFIITKMVMAGAGLVERCRVGRKIMWRGWKSVLQHSNFRFLYSARPSLHTPGAQIQGN